MPHGMANLVIIGAGPIGTAAALAALEDGVADSITSVVDPDPGAREEIRGLTGAAGYASSADLPVGKEGDRAVIAFSSNADKVAPEINRVVTAGYHVVTTCEELAWPRRHVLDALETSARSNGRVVIVTGANPGFVMDRFPLMAAAAGRRVRHITVERRVDTSNRRDTLVAKTGRGRTKDEFDAGLIRGDVGHKGLEASAKLLATGLGWQVHDTRQTIEPILGDDDAVTGLRQHVHLRAEGELSLDLTMVMQWGLEDPVDSVEIDATPPLRFEIVGGYHGDTGTTAQILRALELCHDLEPGFYRPTELPLRYG
jgi:4-hydroxy-tetrahydrodipicolinate reductase